MEQKELTERIIGCAMKVHSTLGPGYLESVYQKALAYELQKAGMKIEPQKPVTVYYEGIVVGDFIVDILVETRVMVELKSNLTLSIAHEVQLVNYLTATGIEVGLLFNFGASSLEFKRKIRTYRPKQARDTQRAGAC